MCVVGKGARPQAISRRDGSAARRRRTGTGSTPRARAERAPRRRRSSDLPPQMNGLISMREPISPDVRRSVWRRAVPSTEVALDLVHGNVCRGRGRPERQAVDAAACDEADRFGPELIPPLIVIHHFPGAAHDPAADARDDRRADRRHRRVAFPQGGAAAGLHRVVGAGGRAHRYRDRVDPRGVRRLPAAPPEAGGAPRRGARGMPARASCSCSAPTA